MNTPVDLPRANTSLTPLRIAAAIGLLVSLVLVGAAFLLAWWLGLLAILLVPVIPMGFVLGFEAIRR